MNAKKPIYAIARRLLSFAAEDRTLITVGALLIVVSSAAETAIPNYSARALAAIIADAGAEVAPPLPGAAAASGAPLSFPTSLRGFVVTALLAAITTGGRVWCTAITEVRLVARIQQRLFDAIIRQDVAFFDAKSSGELTSRLTSDVNVLSVSLTTNLNLIVQNSVNLTGSLVMMFGTQPKLAAVFAVASVLFFWGSKKFGGAAPAAHTRASLSIAPPCPHQPPARPLAPIHHLRRRAAAAAARVLQRRHDRCRRTFRCGPCVPPRSSRIPHLPVNGSACVCAPARAGGDQRRQRDRDAGDQPAAPGALLQRGGARE